MDNLYHQLLPSLEGKIDQCGSYSAVLGFDGTVDNIYSTVSKRHGIGDNFQPFPTIDSFGERIMSAAGKSTAIELYPQFQKVGGNGPIMAGALAPSKLDVHYMGPLGTPGIDPAFSDFSEHVTVHSIGQPAVTHALEFQDGKVMLPVVRPYDEISGEQILSVVGKETLVDLVNKANLLAQLNWTWLPHMQKIYELFLETILPEVDEQSNRTFFFDLSDPAMRSKEAIADALQTISKFETFGKTILGLNLSESMQVSDVLAISSPSSDQDSLQTCAASIREQLDVSTVLIHPVESAACATRDGAYYVDGPYCENPKITTGAGDHLNAGFCLGNLLELNPTECLQLGVLYSGYYVRTGKSPSLKDIIHFIHELSDDK